MKVRQKNERAGKFIILNFYIFSTTTSYQSMSPKVPQTLVWHTHKQ